MNEKKQTMHPVTSQTYTGAQQQTEQSEATQQEALSL